MKKVYLLAFLLVIALVSMGIAADKAHTYKAKLTGGNEVPHVKTKAKGEAVFKKAKGPNEMTYKLTVKDIENATAAHIHEGKKGKSGPPVVMLFSGPKKAGKFSGVLSEGTISANDLMGPLKGKTLKDLIDMIDAGNAYVNVHTDKYPDGEIRGQIK